MRKNTFIKSGRHHFFTLIELLVVVAIIGVLASLLLPVLGKARATAQSAKCISNLKQIGAALQIYANDYDDYSVTLSSYWITGNTNHSMRWYASIGKSTGLFKSPSPNGTPIMDSKALQCPGWFAISVEDQWAKNFHYGLNYKLLGRCFSDATYPPVKLSNLKEVSKRMAVVDSLPDGADTRAMFNFGTSYGGYAAEYKSYAPPAGITSKTYGAVHLRHPNGIAANLTFVDGHAGGVKLTEFKTREKEIWGW